MLHTTFHLESVLPKVSTIERDRNSRLYDSSTIKGRWGLLCRESESEMCVICAEATQVEYEDVKHTFHHGTFQTSCVMSI